MRWVVVIMKLRIVFSNEMPFMIQLPSDDYKVKLTHRPECQDFELILTLTDKMYRLHLDSQPGKGSYRDGLADELENYIEKFNIKNYAFTPLKSYVTCHIERDITITDSLIASVTKEEVIEKNIKPFLISLGIKKRCHLHGNELEEESANLYADLSVEEKKDMRVDVIVKKEFSKLSGYVSLYHKALNKFIAQYRHIRNDIFVEPLTIHTMEGTFVETYIDGDLFEQYKHAGKMPTILTHGQWMQDISTFELQELKNRLLNNFFISPTKDLILTARNLYERGEYRSAVIEANAALEIAVADKITEKMMINGDDSSVIETYLEKTETNFFQRCDYQLKTKTSLSFVTDNPELWNIINSHRKTFRNKVAHTALTPLPEKVEEIIDDYEKAVNWIEDL